jgi:archaellum component FlaC
LDDEIAALKAELEGLRHYCAELRKTNENSQARSVEVQEQYQRAKDRHEKIQEDIEMLNKQFHALSGQLSERCRNVSQDPFDFERFIQFLREMSDLQWNFSGIRDIQRQIEDFDNKLRDIRAKMDRSRDGLERLREQLDAKRSQRDDLRKQVDEMKLDSDHSMHEADGLPVVVSGTELPTDVRQLELADSETAFLFTFLEFRLASGLLRTQQKKLFLVVEFYEHRLGKSQSVEASTGKFDVHVLCLATNDYQLKNYIERHLVHVDLYAVVAQKAIKVAGGSMNLHSFLDGTVDAFRSKIELVAERTVVGEINYEARIFKPLIPS